MKRLLLVLCALSATCFAADPYYGFFPSDLGASYKRFTHNIFGFSVDMPSDWTFGVNGQPPTAVVLLYPEGLDTSKLSPNYQQIEIGILPQRDISLEQASEDALRGMRAVHAGYAIIAEPRLQKLSGRDCQQFTYSWKSKAGFIVKEKVFLVPSNGRIYSVTSRSVSDDGEGLRDRVIQTFLPSAPKF